LLLIIFVTEYLLRVWSSGAHGTYGAKGGWKKYVITPHMIIGWFAFFFFGRFLFITIGILTVYVSMQRNTKPEVDNAGQCIDRGI